VYPHLLYFPYQLCCSEDVEDDMEFFGDKFFQLEFLPLNCLWSVVVFPRELYLCLGYDKIIYYYYCNKRTLIMTLVLSDML
jgi:hypothetical protein